MTEPWKELPRREQTVNHNEQTCATCAHNTDYCEAANKPLDRARYLKGMKTTCFLVPQQWVSSKSAEKKKVALNIAKLKAVLAGKMEQE